MLPKWAAPKALFSNLYSKIETWKSAKVPKSTSQTLAQIDQFYILSSLYFGILMAVDGKAALAFENFELGRKSKDFGDFCDSATRKVRMSRKTNIKWKVNNIWKVREFSHRFHIKEIYCHSRQLPKCLFKNFQTK